jgi:hypothetical protein
VVAPETSANAPVVLLCHCMVAVGVCPANFTLVPKPLQNELASALAVPAVGVVLTVMVTGVDVAEHPLSVTMAWKVVVVVKTPVAYGVVVAPDTSEKAPVVLLCHCMVAVGVCPVNFTLVPKPLLHSAFASAEAVPAAGVVFTVIVTGVDVAEHPLSVTTAWKVVVVVKTPVAYVVVVAPDTSANAPVVLLCHCMVAVGVCPVNFTLVPKPLHNGLASAEAIPAVGVAFTVIVTGVEVAEHPLLTTIAWYVVVVVKDPVAYGVVVAPEISANAPVVLLCHCMVAVGVCPVNRTLVPKPLHSGFSSASAAPAKGTALTVTITKVEVAEQPFAVTIA